MPALNTSKLRDEVKDLIYALANPTDPELSPSEITQRIVQTYGGRPEFHIPTVNTVANYVREAHRARKPKDEPWSLGESLPAAQDAASTKTLLEVWAYCSARDYPLTIRTANWVARLTDVLQSISLSRFECIRGVYWWATLYSTREWSDDAQGKPTNNTRDLDAALALESVTQTVLANAGKLSKLNTETLTRLWRNAKQVEAESSGRQVDVGNRTRDSLVRVDRIYMDAMFELGQPPFNKLDNESTRKGDRYLARREALELWQSWVTLLVRSHALDTYDSSAAGGEGQVLYDLAKEVIDWAPPRQKLQEVFFEPSPALAAKLGVRIEVVTRTGGGFAMRSEIESVKVHRM